MPARRRGPNLQELSPSRAKPTGSASSISPHLYDAIFTGRVCASPLSFASTTPSSKLPKPDAAPGAPPLEPGCAPLPASGRAVGSSVECSWGCAADHYPAGDLNKRTTSIIRLFGRSMPLRAARSRAPLLMGYRLLARLTLLVLTRICWPAARSGMC